MNEWPTELEGACYTREHGWHRPVRQTSGRVRREPIPLHITRAAGLDDHPCLPGSTSMLVLRSEPIRNLIPRRPA